MLKEVEKYTHKQTEIPSQYPLLFAVVAGSRMYGFSNEYSDFDLRGCHVVPLNKVLGLSPDYGDTATQHFERIEGLPERDDFELVSHDVRKYFQLLAKANAHVLEELYSPFILQGGPCFYRLKMIARGLLSKKHSNHYRGMAKQVRHRLDKKGDLFTVKAILHLYRVYFTAIHLMRTKQMVLDLPTLISLTDAPLSSESIKPIAELLERRQDTFDPGHITTREIQTHFRHLDTLEACLTTEIDLSPLPDAPPTSAILELEEYLIEIRLAETEG